MKSNPIQKKSAAFAKRIVKLHRYLNIEKRENILSRQILRSGTSIGANIAEAQFGSSRKDFKNKMYIALKECAETLYWLDLLYEGKYLSPKGYSSMREDCEELRRILSAITKTLNEQE